MQVGSLVELVENFKDAIPFYVTIPVKGIIYTVRGMRPGIIKDDIFITLEEIVNVRSNNGEEYCFYSDLFRELQPPITISIDEIVREGAPA